METLEVPQVEFKSTDKGGLLERELPAPPQYPELESSEEFTSHSTTDSALIGNQIYGEMPSTNQVKTDESGSNGTFKSKYEKQNLGVLEKIREHQAEIRRQKAEIATQQQTVTEIQQILETPPPTAGEQLKETWERLKALVKNINIIDVQTVQSLPASPIEEQLKKAKEKLQSLHTYVPKSPEEAREIDQIAREAVSPQLATENRASDIARSLESTISDAYMDNATVRHMVQDYMNTHSEIVGDRNRITQRAYERIVNKLAARRMLEKNNPDFIKKISIEPRQPIITHQTTRQSETPIHRTEVQDQPQRRKVNVDSFAKAIITRIQTDIPRNIETEETRKHREIAANNPEAVIGIPLPLRQETTEDMLQRNIDAVLVNNPGVVDLETRNAIAAQVREEARDRLTLIDRTNTVAERILRNVPGRPDTVTVNAAVDNYLQEHIGDQNLNRNEVVRRAQSLAAMRPILAPEGPDSTNRKIDVISTPSPVPPIPPDDNKPQEKSEPVKILSSREKEDSQYDHVTNAIFDITYQTGNPRSIHEIEMYIDRYVRINNLTQDTNGNITLGNGEQIRRDRLAKNLLRKFNGTTNNKGLWQVFKEAWGFKS